MIKPKTQPHLSDKKRKIPMPVGKVEIPRRAFIAARRWIAWKAPPPASEISSVTRVCYVTPMPSHRGRRKSQARTRGRHGVEREGAD